MYIKSNNQSLCYECGPAASKLTGGDRDKREKSGKFFFTGYQFLLNSYTTFCSVGGRKIERKEEKRKKGRRKEKEKKKEKLFFFFPQTFRLNIIKNQGICSFRIPPNPAPFSWWQKKKKRERKKKKRNSG